MKEINKRVLLFPIAMSIVLSLFVSCSFFSEESENKHDFTLVVRNNTDSTMNIKAVKYSSGVEEEKTFTLNSSSKYTTDFPDLFEGDVKLLILYNGKEYSTEAMYVDKILNGIVFSIYLENENLACKCSDYGLLKLMYNDFKTTVIQY